MKNEKMVKVWAVIPNDFEYSVQYMESRESAESLAESYESGAKVFFEEMPLRIVQRKQLKTAKKGYRV